MESGQIQWIHNTNSEHDFYIHQANHTDIYSK